MGVKIFTARQPIFDRKKRVVAYELLFRDSEKNCFPVNVPEEVATSKLLVNTLLNMDIDDVCESKPALINFPASILKSKFADLVPTKKIVIEILETVEPNDENYEWISQLFHRGYHIALDDFVYKPEWERFLKFIKLIKLDVRATSEEDIKALLPKLQSRKIKVLAEKVETYDEYNKYLEMGFDYFQGYFFCKPEMIHSTGADVSHSILIKIYQEAMKENPDMKIVRNYFTQEPRLTFKLMRYVKKISGRDISSVPQGIAYLGLENLRKLSSLLVTAEINPTKPHALVKTSVVRSRFCELIAANTKYHSRKDEAFMVGMFSTMDALLDREMSAIVESLPLASDIESALLDNKSNILGKLLSMAINYERGDFDIVNLQARTLKIDKNMIPLAYKKAMKWENMISKFTNKEPANEELREAV